MRKILAVAAATLVGVFGLVVPAGASTHKPQASCVTAIRDYRQVLTDLATFVKYTGNYAALIYPAEQAGANQSVSAINSVVAKEKALNAEVTVLSDKLGALVGPVDNAADKCDAGR